MKIIMSFISTYIICFYQTKLLLLFNVSLLLCEEKFILVAYIYEKNGKICYHEQFEGLFFRANANITFSIFYDKSFFQIKFLEG